VSSIFINPTLNEIYLFNFFALQVLVAMASIPAIFVLSKTGGFVGIWVALTIFMGLRTFAGVWR
jgi:hypothetical protein